MSGRFGVMARDEVDLLCNETPDKSQLSTLKNQRERAAAKEKKEKEAPSAGRWGGRLSDKAWGGDAAEESERRFRDNLTPEEKERMQKYGSLRFKSAAKGRVLKNTREEAKDLKNVMSGRRGGRRSPHVADSLETPKGGRKLRDDLTPEEKERMSKYGSLSFKSPRNPYGKSNEWEKFIPGSKNKTQKFPADDSALGRRGGRRSPHVMDSDEDIALKDKTRDIPGFATDPPVSEAQRKAMFAAKSGKSTLGIPQSVGKEFAEADPGGKLPEHK